MQIIKNIILTVIFLLFSSSLQAESENNNEKATLREPAEFQRIIDEYKAYLAKIPVEIRDEIVKYRKAIAKLNMQKRNLYKKLSQESQNYLKKEQEYKQRLPLNRRQLINLQKQSQVEKEKK